MVWSWILSLKNHDWVLNGASCVVICIGLLSLFSAGTDQFYKQLIWIFLGGILFLVVSSLDYRIFSAHFFPALALYLVSVLGIVAVDLVGITVRGSERWIDTGLFLIEPVEPLKIALILILAKYFSVRNREVHKARNVIVPVIYFFIPAFLVFLQPDLGSLIVLFGIWLGMVIVAGTKMRHSFVIVLGGISLSVIAWLFFLYDYQKERIISFLNPSLDPLGSSYNAIQSVITVSSGGLWGKGLGQGTQAQLGFLPEATTDFIYAAIVEEMGIIVGCLIIVLFCVIVWRLCRIALRARSNFARIAVFGVALLIAIQAGFNIGMVVGILPITGLTLPLMSYGGSSMVTICVALGIAQSVHRNSYVEYEKTVVALE